MNCINRSHPDFIKLLTEARKRGIDSFTLELNISKHMETNETFPTIDQITTIPKKTEFTEDEAKTIVNKWKSDAVNLRGQKPSGEELNDLDNAANALFKKLLSLKGEKTNKAPTKATLITDLFDRTKDKQVDLSKDSPVSDLLNIATRFFNKELYDDSAIKPGVPELFESNPELANAVYEVLSETLPIVDDKRIKESSGAAKLYSSWEEYLSDLKGLGIKNVKDASKFDMPTNRDELNEYNEKLINKYVEAPARSLVRDLLKKGKTPFASNVFGAGLRGVWVGGDYKSGEFYPLLDFKQQALQLYSQYLDTIFPDSKVKDIVYHGTDNPNFSGFGKDFNRAIHFGTLQAAKDRRSHTDFEFKNNAKFIPTLLNAKNPLKSEEDFNFESEGLEFEDSPEFDLTKEQGHRLLITYLYNKGYNIYHPNGGTYTDGEILNNAGLDSVVYKNEREDKGNYSYAVFEPEQIHILGSKQDIEGFKDYINYKLETKEIKQGVSELFESNPELANVVYEAAGFKQNNALQAFKSKLIDIIGVDKIKELYAGTDVKFNSFVIDDVELGTDKDLIITIKTDKGQRTAINLRLDGDYQQLKISEGGRTIRGIFAPLSEKKTAIDFLISEFKNLDSTEITPQQKQQAVSELFESNPELANAVYEALGFGNSELSDNPKKLFKKTLEDTYGTLGGKWQYAIRTLDDGIQAIVNNERNIGWYEVDNIEVVINKLKKNNINYIKLNENNLIIYSRGSEQQANLLKYYITNRNNINIREFDTAVGYLLQFPESLNWGGINIEIIKDLKDKLKITPQQKQQAIQSYSQYLNTIFPDSKVKDIVYHGTLPQNKFEKFDKQKGTNLSGEYGGIHFGDLTAAIERPTKIVQTENFLAGVKEDLSNFKPNIIPTILNISNIKRVEEGKNWGQGDWNKLISKEKEADAFVYTNKIENKGVDSYVVFEPEQIHILGSKQDIEGFKEFVNKEQTPNNEFYSIQPDLKKVAAKYNMNTSGFMPSTINPQVLQKELNQFPGVKVKKASNGNYYLTRGKNKFYNPFNSYYQLTNEELPVDEELDKIVMTFLNQVGATVNWTIDLENDAAGRVNVLTRIIDIVRTKQGLDTLTEEAVHIMVQMMRGTNSYNLMMATVRNMPEYQEVLDEYQDLDNYDDNKITEEAVAKKITKYVTEKYLNDKEKSLIRRWWDSLIEALRKVFKPEATDEFKKAAERLLKNKTIPTVRDSTPTLENAEEWFYQRKITPNKDVFDSRKKMLDDIKSSDISNEEGSYILNGKKIPFRVSDLVRDYLQEIYNQNEFQAKNKSFYTTRGTIVHLYAQLIMEELIDVRQNNRENKNINIDKIKNIVFNTLKDNPEFKEFQNKKYYDLTDSSFKNLLSGVKQIYDDIIERDSGARFYTEFTVYDESAKIKGGLHGIAGTLDLLVLHSDGTVSIYDYKGIRFKENKVQGGYYTTADKKRQGFEYQLFKYKNILKTMLNISDQEFRSIRIVPINIQYDFDKESSIKTIEIASRKENKVIPDHIKQMSVAREYVKGDESLNAFLEKIYNLRDQLRSEANVSRGKKLNQLNAKIRSLTESINSLLVEEDIIATTSAVEEIVNQVFANKASLTNSQVLQLIDQLDLYSGFNTAYRKFLDEITDEEYKKLIKQRIDHFNNQIDSAKQDLEFRALTLAEEITNVSRDKLLKGGEVVGPLSHYLMGMGRWKTPVIVEISKIFAEQEEKVRMKLRDERKVIEKIDSEYREWAKKKGLSGLDIFDPIYDEKTGHLIYAFTREFWETRDKMIESGNAKFYEKDNYSSELAWMKEHFEFDEASWQKEYDRVKEYYESTPLLNKIKDEKLSFVKLYNPAHNDQAWFRNKNYHIKPKKHTEKVQSKYVSEKFKNLYVAGNEPLLAYYEMYIKYNKEIRTITGDPEITNNFVANIHKKTIEGLVKNGPFSVKQSFFESLEILENDTRYGVTDSKGKQLKKIPLLYVNNLKGSHPTEEEKQKIRSEIKHPVDSVEYVQEYNDKVNKLVYQKGVENKSKDLTQSLILMLESAYDYHFKDEIEESILLLKYITTLDYYKEHSVDKYGVRIWNKISDQAAESLGASKTTKDAIDSFINMRLYQQSYQDRDMRFKMSSNEDDERNFSTVGMIRLGHNYLTAKALGLNPILAGASFLNGMLNVSIVGKKKTYFGNQEHYDAIKLFTSGDLKVKMAIDFLEPTSRDHNKEEALKKSASSAVRTFNMRNLLVGHRKGDDLIDNTILIAIMKSWVIDSDGKLRNKYDLINPPKNDKAQTVWEAFEIEGDAMDIKGLSFSEFTRLRRIVSEAQFSVKGSMTKDQQNIANTTLVGMLLLKFRNWMYPLIDERTSDFKYNPILESYYQGHFRTAFSEVFGGGKIEEEGVKQFIPMVLESVVKSLEPLIKLLLEIAHLGILPYKSSVDERKSNIYYMKHLNENPDLDPKIFTLEKYKDFRRRQLDAFVFESRMLLGIGIIVTGIMSAVGWDDEDESNIVTYNLYKLMRRTSLELSFFYSPESVDEIMKSPVPLWRVATSTSKAVNNFLQESSEFVTGTENRRDRTPFLYYTMKETPVLNQVLSIGGYFDHIKDRGAHTAFGDSFERFILSR